MWVYWKAEGWCCDAKDDDEMVLEIELERLSRLWTTEVVGAGVHGVDASDWGRW